MRPTSTTQARERRSKTPAPMPHMPARRTAASHAPAALRALEDPACLGVLGLRIVCEDPLWDEESLPFQMMGGGNVVRLVPRPGFRKESLAASEDERAVVVDCHDAPGWLVPTGIVRSWMARHVHHDELEDFLLSHPVYEHITRTDEQGHSRGGRIPIVTWEPGIPNHAEILPPEFLPDDYHAPAVNRERWAYTEAVADVLAGLRRFKVVEAELTFAFDTQ